MATFSQAIWKDCYVTLGTSSVGMNFRIQLIKRDNNFTTIYTGKAYARPGTTSVVVKVNDICADYLQRAYPPESIEGDWQDAKFSVQFQDSYGIWGIADTITFYRDWSYNTAFIPGTDAPLDSITGLVSPGGFLPLYSKTGEFTAHIGGGDYNNDFSLDFRAADWYIENVSNGVTYFLDLRDYPGAKWVEANGRRYTLAQQCGGWCLYYINAYGGWDALPVEGRTIRRANLTRYQVAKEYDNRTYPARGLDNYASEIEGRFVFNVGPLTTEQSRKMHHLLGSTFVYAHDLEGNRVHPVVLSGNYEILDRAGALVTYQVEAVLAQDRLRR